MARDSITQVVCMMMFPALAAMPLRASAQTAPCDSLTWSRPVAISPDAGRAAAWSSFSVVASSSRTLVVGERLPDSEPNSRPDVLRAENSTLDVLELGRGSVASLRRAGRYQSPKAAFGPNGDLHVLWAANDHRPEHAAEHGPARIGSRQPVSVWHATLGADGWSEAVEVYRSTVVHWSAGNLTGLATDADGTIHVAFTASTPADSRAVYLRRTTDGVWTRREIEIQGGVNYASLAVGDGRTLYLVIVGVILPIDGPTANNLYFLRSTDAGRTWSTPTLLSWSGDRQASRPSLFLVKDRQDQKPTAGEGTLHLVWGQNLTGGMQAEAIRHRSSSDGGTTWSEPSDHVIGGMSSLLRVVVDRCGRLHAVYVHRISDRHPRVSRVMFADGAWSRAEEIFPGTVGFSPELAVGSDGRINMVWKFAASDTLSWADVRLSHSVMGSR